MALFDPIRIGSSAAGGDYEVERSLRFNRSDQTILSKSLSTSPTNRKKTTVSLWVKRALLGTAQGVLTSAASGTGANQDATRIYFNSDDTMILQTAISNSNVWSVTTYRKFRDTNAWMHILVAIDTTQSTASNRVKLYINGVQETDFSSASYPNQNYDDYWAYGNYRIGDWGGDAGYYVGFEGYLAEIVQIDGQALDYTSFTEADAVTNELKPKDPSSLTFGTNGFHLKFADNSGTSATTLGKDSSGVGNNFTPSNFSVSAGNGNDSKTDTPTLNKATLNSVTGFSNNATLAEGNLKMTGSAGFKDISTISVPGTGKFYYEVVRTISAGWQLVGVFVGQPNNPSNALSNSAIWGFASTQATYFGGSYTSTSNVPSWSTNDVMGIKYENGTLKLYKNGTLAAASTSSVPTGDIVFAYIANDNTNSASFVRFSYDDWTQDSAAGVDATWELSSTNISDPTIEDPKDHFDLELWSGTQTTHNITGFQFQPDFVWVKKRNGAEAPDLQDAVRGATKRLTSHNGAAEITAVGSIDSFNSDGFTVKDAGTTNESGYNYVGWAWNGGGSTATNNDGSLTSQVRANPTAGFSVGTFTAQTSGSATVGHGLGAAPQIVITKSRSLNANWYTYSEAIGANGWVLLDSTGGATTGNSAAFGTAPTSSVFTFGSGLVNFQNMVFYAFSSVEGYSKFGSYEGNGSTDGPFIYTGFKPSLFITRRIDGGSNWYMWDTKRRTYNVNNAPLQANDAGGEATNYDNSFDVLANGFKARASNAGTNSNGDTYIYLAWADFPFKYARAH